MAYHHLANNVDHYTLFIDNKETEDALNDTQLSSASDFSILLNPQLDLSSLLYLRAVEAKIAVGHLFLDNLPLTYTESEVIKVNLTIPLDSVNGNMNFNRTATELQNNIPLQLGMSDFCSSDPQETLQFANDILHYSINHFITYRYLLSFLDCNVFEDDYLHTLLPKDINLLQQYVNIALISRQAVCNLVAKKIGDKLDPTPLVLASDIQGFTAATEKTTLNASKCLRSLESRPSKIHKYIDFTLFYNIDISKTPEASEDVKSALTAVETEALRWLTDMGLFETTADGSLTTDNIKTLEGILTSNRMLIQHGLNARRVLLHTSQRKDNRTKVSKDIFTNDILALSIDKTTKCQFHVNPGLFLANDGSSCTIYFPQVMSRVLGSQGNNIVVGPLTAPAAPTTVAAPATPATPETPATPATPTTPAPAAPAAPEITPPKITPPKVPPPKITTNICHSHQKLPSQIIPLPKMIHVISDIIADQSRDLWLQSTPYSDFHIIFSMNIDEYIINNRVLSKQGDECIFYKIQKVNNILERFSIKILDHNLKQCIFPRNSYTKLALVIKPAILDSS